MTLNELIALQNNPSSFLDDPLQTNDMDLLPDAQQRYASGIAEDLGYAPGQIKTEEDWRDLDESQKKVLQEEEALNFYERSVQSALYGNAFAETEKMAKDLVARQTVEGGYDHAAAVSAVKEIFAKADINNPEHRLMSEEVKNEMQRIHQNYAVVVDAKEKAEKEAKKVSTMETVRDFLGTAPGFEAARYKEAIGALGLKGKDVFGIGTALEQAQKAAKKLSASEYSEIFCGVMYKALYDNKSVDYQTASGLLDYVVRRWNDAGINKELQARLLGDLANYDPSLYDFNAALLIPTAGESAKFFARGAGAASKGLWGAALKQTAKGVLEAGSIPGAETMVNVSVKGINRVARPFKDASKLGETLKKASAVKDRALAKEIIEDIVERPTLKDRSIKATRDVKDDTIKYTIDDIASPVVNPGKSYANDPATIASKIKVEFNQRLQKFLQRSSHIENVTKAHLTTLYKQVMDSLDLNDLAGVGRGNSGGKIIGFEDIMFSKDDNVIFAVRLTDKGGPLSPFTAKVEKGVDVGRKNAEKAGRKFTKMINSTTDTPYNLDYRIDDLNGVYGITLLIDTHKGLGKIAYDALVADKMMKQPKYRPFLSSVFTRTSNPTDIQLQDSLRNIEAAILQSDGKSVIDSFKDLKKEDRAVVQGLLDVSTKYGAWYDPEHLLLRGVGEEATRVYMNARLLNDFDDFIRNKYMRIDLITKGGKRVSFNDKLIDGVVRPVKDYHTPSELAAKIGDRGVLVDAIEGTPKHISDNKELIKNLFDKGYILLEPSISPDATISARSFYYLLNPQSTVVNDLGAFVTTYVAGGRRFFNKNAAYIKQLVVRETEKGQRAIVGSQTFFTDLDETGLINRNDVLERLRKLSIQGKEDEGNRLIADQNWYKAPFQNMKEFREYFEQLGMDFTNLDNPLEVVKEGGILTSYDTLKNTKDTIDYVGLEGMKEFAKNSHFQAISNESRIQRMRRTGRELLTWDFEAAQPVDFEMQMRYLVNDMVQQGVMGTYTDYVATRFAAAFGDLFEQSEGQKTPRELLIGGTPKNVLNSEQKTRLKEALTAQRNYRMIRGTSTTADTQIAEAFNALADWVIEGTSKTLHLSENSAHKVRVNWEKFQEFPILRLMRETASHWTIGCFNVSQFWKQAGQNISIFLADPLSATVSGDVLPMLGIMSKAGGDRVKAIRLAEEVFKDNKEMLNNALNLIDMGFFEHGVAGGFIERGATVKSALNKFSYLPFNTGEMSARLTSGLTSLKRNNLYGIRATSEQLQRPLLYAQSLYMNMDATGISRLQNSEIASTILQFMNPKLRFVETVLFDKNLTRAQRLKWGLGLAALVGTEGILGVEASSWVSTNVFRMFHDEEESPVPALEDRNEIMRLVQRGILNYFSEESGLGVDFSQLANAPEVFELADYLSGAEVFKNVISLQVPYKGIQAGLSFAKTAYHTFFGEATEDDLYASLERVARASPFIVKRPFLGYLFYTTGMRLNTKGELSERSNNKLQAVLYGLGFDSLSDKDMAKYWVEYSDYNKRMKAVEDEGYEMFMRALKTNSTWAWAEFESSLKYSGLYARDRAIALNRIIKRAKDKAGVSAVERGLLQQYRTAGSSGTNLINLNR